MSGSSGDNRWSRCQKLGDCKTCLCRISPHKNRPEISESDDEISNGSSELCDSQMSSQLLRTLKSMRDDESLCDVTICVGESTSLVKYPAHKIVLAAASPYFRKMFSCGLRESQNGQVKFHDMLPSVLSSVLDFIYTGKIQMDEAIVDGLLDAADLLQLPSLRMLCLWWLTNNLSASTCLGIYVMALIRHHLDLAETAKLYAVNHFREVMQGEEFLHISLEYLIGFLEVPFLACDNDGLLLKGLLEWVNHDLSGRKSFIRELTGKLNLEEIAPQILIEVIHNPAIAGNLELETEIREALTNILSRQFDNLTEPLEDNAPIRHIARFYNQQTAIFAVGGESQGQSLSNVECFMVGKGDGWKCSIPFENGSGRDFSDVAVIPTMKQCRFYAAVASQQYKMYVIGGQDCGFPLNIVERYDILQNRWETLSPLPVSVHGCAAAFVNSRLFVVGGRSSKQNEKFVWVYDEKEDCWQESPPMKQRRAHLSVGGFNGELFAIGGMGGKNETDDNFLNTVEKLDLLTNTWTTLAPMHEERAFHNTAIIDCFVYSIGGCDGKNWLRTAERYDTMCGQWSKISNMSVPRSSFGVATLNGRLYLVGGFDGVHFLKTAEKYNPRTDRWHVSSNMKIERYGLAVAQLSLPLKSMSIPNEYS